MNKKEVFDRIGEALKAHARLRSARGLPPEPPPEARVVRVRKIAKALEKLAFIREAKDDYEAFEKSMEALVDAACDERWHLVKEAADLLIAEYYLPRLCRENLVYDAKFIAYSLAQIDEPKLGKSEILRIMKQVYPDVHSQIPRSKGELTDWWKEIGEVDRATGGGIDKHKKHKESVDALIEQLEESRKAGFPEFMGPRYDPHWEGKQRYD